MALPTYHGKQLRSSILSGRGAPTEQAFGKAPVGAIGVPFCTLDFFLTKFTFRPLEEVFSFLDPKVDALTYGAELYDPIQRDN